MIDKRVVIEWFKSQIGYHEKATNDQLEDFYANAGSNNFNKYSDDLDKVDGFYNFKGKNGHPWCDTFVDDGFKVCYGATIAMQLLCQPPYSAGAGCEYSAQYYEQQGRFFVTGPQTGDQIFFDYGGGINHTGIVVEVGQDYIKTIEGNSDDQVQECTYQLNANFIAGYGRPRWDLDGEPDIPKPDEPTQDTCEVTATLPIIRYGDVSMFVKVMQVLLIGKGFSCGRFGADGEYGTDTKIGLFQFQKANDIISLETVCDQETWEKILN